MIKVEVALTVRGGFKSNRGTYTGYRIAKSSCEGNRVEDSSEAVDKALKLARERLQGDEVIIKERVDIQCVLINEKA